MPRLLFITERFPPDIGGLAASSARICAGLAGLGIAVDVLAWSRHVPAGKMVEQTLEGQASNLKIYRQGMYRQWDMTMPSTMNVLEWLHQQHKYDAVWGHYLAAAGFLAVWFAEMSGIPATVSARGNDVDMEIFPPGDLSRLLWTLKRANMISAVSKDMARKIQVLSGRDDLELLPNFVDMAVFNSPGEKDQSMKSSLGILPEEFVLGFSGELREKKGVQFLLDSFREVRRQHPCCLLIIGDLRANQRTNMQLFAAEFPEDFARIIITGHLQEPASVARHLNLCDFYLQPSLLEGMPNSLLEAMACSRVCIASDAGGIPELIDHGQNGFILPRAQLNHLGTALQEAIELDAETRSKIAEAAREKVLSVFSLEHEKTQLERLMHRLLSNSSYRSTSSLPV